MLLQAYATKLLLFFLFVFDATSCRFRRFECVFVYFFIQTIHSHMHAMWPLNKPFDTIDSLIIPFMSIWDPIHTDTGSDFYLSTLNLADGMFLFLFGSLSNINHEMKSASLGNLCCRRSRRRDSMVERVRHTVMDYLAGCLVKSIEEQTFWDKISI